MGKDAVALSQSVEEVQKLHGDKARLMMSGFAERAAAILQELAEYSENDRIRLSAANSILDRAGVQAPQEHKVTVSPEEHQLVRAEAEETLERIGRNVAKQQERKAISLEAIVLHEGVDDEPEGAS